MEVNKIYNENCLETMARMPDGFIDLTVTSPPYDNVRDYDGHNFDFKFEFKLIADELWRILKVGGVIAWIIGDGTVKYSKTGTGARQLVHFLDMGFNLHQKLYYEKTGPPPDPTRYEDTIEEIFILSKGRPKTINLLKDKKNRWAKVQQFGKRSTREKDGSLTKKKALVIGEFGKRTCVWNYATGFGYSTKDEIAFNHPAIFPEALCGDLIHSYSNEGDLIYDPFSGSGTTAKCSFLMYRQWVASEISKGYCELAEKRLKKYLSQTRLPLTA